MPTIKSQIAQVAEFMTVAGQSTHYTEVPVSLGVANLRHTLILEEVTGVNEFAYCAERDDLVGTLDGLCDILYVVYGAALTFGVDIVSIIGDRTVPYETGSVLAPAHVTLSTIQYMEQYIHRFAAGFGSNNYKEIANALAAIVSATFTYADKIKVDLAGAFSEVHDSNMSKFSETEEHAIESAKVRLEHGDTKYKDVYTTSVEVNGKTVWMIKRKEDHKILKSLNFFEPDLSVFVK